MRRLAAASLFMFLGSDVAAVAEALDDTIARASKDTLLSMPEPPLGYSVTKHPSLAGKKLLGFQVQAVKEGTLSKVVIKIELRDLSDRKARVAASKGYVNGFAAGLRAAGYKITAKKIPDLEKSDFKTPIIVDLTFVDDEDNKILVKKRIFFSTVGYDVSVIATNEGDLRLLSDWAARIRPAASPSE